MGGARGAHFLSKDLPASAGASEFEDDVLDRQRTGAATSRSVVPRRSCPAADPFAGLLGIGGAGRSFVGRLGFCRLRRNGGGRDDYGPVSWGGFFLPREVGAGAESPVSLPLSLSVSRRSGAAALAAGEGLTAATAGRFLSISSCLVSATVTVETLCGPLVRWGLVCLVTRTAAGCVVSGGGLAAVLSEEGFLLGGVFPGTHMIASLMQCVRRRNG